MVRAVGCRQRAATAVAAARARSAVRVYGGEIAHRRRW